MLAVSAKSNCLTGRPASRGDPRTMQNMRMVGDRVGAVLFGALSVFVVVTVVAAIVFVDDLIDTVFEFIADHALIIVIVAILVCGGAVLFFQLFGG